LLCRQARGRPFRDQNIDVETHQLRRKRRELVPLPGGGSTFDDDVAALDVAELAEPLAQILESEFVPTREMPEKADPVHRPGRLRDGNEGGREEMEGKGQRSDAE
jgi:hypothetical protein